MIDIHCHILPGTDDGAADLSEAIAMAEAAAADGVAEVVATPHWMTHERKGLAELHWALAELGESLALHGLPVRVHAGAEILLEPDLPMLARRGKLPTLCSGPYILVEPPFAGLTGFTEQTLFELQALGLRPIVAHPERCATFQADLGRLVLLVGRGVRVQLNAGSLMGHYGGRAQAVARQMLRWRLAHAIASDGHDLFARRPLLSAAARAAAEIVGEEGARLLVVDNPAAILAGRPLAHPPPAELPARPPRWRRWFSFLAR